MKRNSSKLVQEPYNVDCIKQKQAGLLIPSFRNIAGAVEQFLDPETLARYRVNVAAINNRAVFEISESLQEILATSYKTAVAAPLKQR